MDVLCESFHSRNSKAFQRKVSISSSSCVSGCSFHFVFATESIYLLVACSVVFHSSWCAWFGKFAQASLSFVGRNKFKNSTIISDTILTYSLYIRWLKLILLRIHLLSFAHILMFWLVASVIRLGDFWKYLGYFLIQHLATLVVAYVVPLSVVIAEVKAMTCQSEWPDWAIFCTLGNFLKPLTTIDLPKSPTF